MIIVNFKLKDLTSSDFGPYEDVKVVGRNFYGKVLGIYELIAVLENTYIEEANPNEGCPPYAKYDLMWNVNGNLYFDILMRTE